MRLKRLNTSEQVSFKQRNVRKSKKSYLKFGNSGFLILRSVQFEYAYFYLIKRFLKYFFKFKYSKSNFFKVWIFLKANFPISRKSKNARMGKGKGAFNRWIIKLNRGHIFIEFSNVNEIRLKKLANYWNKMLGFNVIFLKKK